MSKITSVKKKKITLSFDYEAGKEVFVAGDFNDWTLSEQYPKKLRRLKEDDKREGHYTINMFLPMGEHEYKFFADQEWFLDPAAEEKTPNIFGSYNSILKVS